jgi:hypothetical protein
MSYWSRLSGSESYQEKPPPSLQALLEDRGDDGGHALRLDPERAPWQLRTSWKAGRTVNHYTDNTGHGTYRSFLRGRSMPSDRPSGGAAASTFSKLLALGAEGRAARRSVYLNHGLSVPGAFMATRSIALSQASSLGNYDPPKVDEFRGHWQCSGSQRTPARA